MFANGIGEVEFVWKKVPAGGFLLRENNGLVTLEEYLDESGENIDIVHCFEEDYTLNEKNHFVACLAEARQYLPDPNLLIYIQSSSARYAEEKEEREKRKKELEQTVEKFRRCPWKYPS